MIPSMVRLKLWNAPDRRVDETVNEAGQLGVMLVW